MRIVFMGTPEFAATSLNSLIYNGFNVVGVFTQPDKPSNRGMKLTASPVKELAESANIPLFQPERMRESTALKQLKSLSPDLVVVVAYGRILPEEMLAIPPLGCINVHGSLLPKYRGAAPIQQAILNGDKVTGVTSIYLSNDMDAGDIIYSAETEIGEFETSGDLFSRLSDMGAKLLCKTVRAIKEGIAPRIPQDHSKATYAEKLNKDISPIVWTKSPREIIKHICGLNPWPIATAELLDTKFRIYSAEYTDTTTCKPAGSLVSAEAKKGIEVACANGKTILITRLQALGGKQMSAADYLLGHPVKIS